MAYATIGDLRAELGSQLPADEETDGQLQRKLEAATAVIDKELGYSFESSAAGTAVAYGDGTIYLQPPPFVEGSVTGVTTISGLAVPDYIEQDGLLVVVDADGVIASDRAQIAGAYGVNGLCWQAGVPYTVSATFGYAVVPADIVEITLQIAVRLWRGKDTGYSDVVGVEGSGGVGYNGALPNFVKRVLDNYRENTTLGVW